MTTNPPLPKIPVRAADAHKGDFGKLLLIGGSRGMAGSISLSGMAALRTGAGLVTVATPMDCLDVVAGFCPSYMTWPLTLDSSCDVTVDSVNRLNEPLDRANVVACGPGLGRSEGVTRFVIRLQSEVRQPMVLDADALNALASDPAAIRTAAGARVLTPHLGEFARLVQRESIDAESARRLAVEKAKQWSLVLVLKGNHTLVTDGQTVYENQTGNPGMATGGSGDVLTGVIASLLGQGLEPFAAAQLGVYLHGLAGDMAAEVHGEAGMISEDLLDLLPQACAQKE